MSKQKQAFALSKINAKVAIPLSALVFFVMVCLSAVSTVKVAAMIAICGALIGGIAGFGRLRERFTPPMMALALFITMGGISTFYALSGKFALQEFLKLLIGFCFAVFMLAVTPGKDAAPARRIASVLTAFTAFSGLVSIDMISTRILSGAVTGFLSLFSTNFPVSYSGLEVGTRITSIFLNPNVFGSIVGLGVLLSLSLVVSSENQRERTGHLICLYLNALSFLLAFSMGSIAFIAAAFVLYLLSELPERRAHLFVLMVETLILALISTALISMTSFDAWERIQPVPIVCAALGCAALCLADRFAGQAIGIKLSAHNKLLTAFICAVLSALVVFVLLAYNLTGPITLSAGESVRRSAYPAPGEYTISAQADGDVRVIVRYQNKIDTMMHTETVLYRGALSEAAFTVPEDSLVVYFTFSSKEGANLESVECVGEETVSVPLGYRLLPSFIANRLQGLFANENAIQRTVFFDDGMKLFKRSPIVGLGLGGYENAIKSAQSFFYETKYAHNHYIQTLSELGIVGLFLFVFMLFVCAAAVWFDRRKKENSHPLTPALGAALLFMAGHALMEVTFSYFAYLPIALCVIALIAMCCGDAIPLPKLTSTAVKNGAVFVCSVLIAVFTYFLINNISAAGMVKQNHTMKSLANAASMDKFEYADHMLSYVLSADNFPDNYEIQEQASEYLLVLGELNSNSVPIYLANYYFEHGKTEAALNMIEKYLRYCASDERAWAQALNILKANYNITNLEYYKGMTRITAFYNEWTANNIGTINLSETDQTLLAMFDLGKDN